MRSKAQREAEAQDMRQQEGKSYATPDSKKSSRLGVYAFSVTVFVAAFVLVCVLCAAMGILNAWAVVAAAFVGVLACLTVRVAPQWERVVVLRLGAFHRVAGPGLYCMIPVLEYAAAHVDQRIITTPFIAEEALTADLVPLDIDAVLFWMVWNPKDACVEVEDYSSAIWWAAQTALRDAVGRINLAEVATRREQIDEEVKVILDEKTNTWGITVVSVEIRDIAIPEELQDAMSKEAQAERERNARLLLAEVEKDISEMFVDAASVYDRNDKAMQLRTMNLIYESVKEKGGLVIAPSAFSEGFNNIESFFKQK